MTQLDNFVDDNVCPVCPYILYMSDMSEMSSTMYYPISLGVVLIDITG